MTDDEVDPSACPACGNHDADWEDACCYCPECGYAGCIDSDGLVPEEKGR